MGRLQIKSREDNDDEKSSKAVVAIKKVCLFLYKKKKTKKTHTHVVTNYFKQDDDQSNMYDKYKVVVSDFNAGVSRDPKSCKSVGFVLVCVVEFVVSIQRRTQHLWHRLKCMPNCEFVNNAKVQR